MLGFSNFALGLGTPELDRPNVVYILADDLGYGDVSALNESAAWTTPHLDSIAAQGMLFTDAHSGSAVWRIRVPKGLHQPPSLPCQTISPPFRPACSLADTTLRINLSGTHSESAPFRPDADG